MQAILDAIGDPGSTAADIAALPLPAAYRAVTLHRDEEHMFDGLEPPDRDPRAALHLEEVPVPEAHRPRDDRLAAGRGGRRALPVGGTGERRRAQ